MPADPYVETSHAETLVGTLYDDLAVPVSPCVSRGAILWSLSRAFDLAEGREPGHAQRVTYVGLAIARMFRLTPREQEYVFFACLLHDAGMAAWHGSPPFACAEKSAPVPNAADREAELHMLGFHAERGARLAEQLGLDEPVVAAIAQHHDTWNAHRGTSTLIGRIVAAADRFESFLDGGGGSLRLRRQGNVLVEELAGTVVDPEIAACLRRLTCSDRFWLGLHDNDLATTAEPGGFGPLLAGDDLMNTLGVVSDVVDERNAKRPGRGRSVSEMARNVALACMFTERRADMVKAAALMQDIGTLGVPAAHLRKPDILTIDEMAEVQLHPTFARDILSEIPGFGAASWWVACHHERVDGKGYPGMLSGHEVPLEAQIIGMCEMYAALTSDRPFRPAMSPAEAAEVMVGNVEARFSADLFAIFRGVAGPFDA